MEFFGQTGTIGDLYRHYGIDRYSIVDRVASLTAGRLIGGRPVVRGNAS